MVRDWVAHDPATGRFVQQVEPWTPDKWNQGYVDKKGKFRVYRPDCPCAWPSGYAFRCHVVFWLANGFCHQAGEVIHHRDENKLNDSIENLELKTHGQHTHDHCFQQGIKLTCRQCGKDFYVKQFRIDQRRREGQREIKYCSQRCYKIAPKSQESRLKQSRSLKRAYSEGRRISYGRKGTFIVA